ncbi:MAG: sigma-54-dependent transcriptional regulator [Candidatus Binataceae bacterium]
MKRWTTALVVYLIGEIATDRIEQATGALPSRTSRLSFAVSQIQLRGLAPLYLDMAKKNRILVADDDVAVHEDWRDTLSSWGYQVAFAADGEKALELTTSFQPHVLLCDLRMPRKGGLEVLSELKQLGSDMITVMISGAGEIDDAVRAIKLGAYDYLTKPVDLERLRNLLNNVSAHIMLGEENQRLRRNLIHSGTYGPVVGRSLGMRRVMTLAEQIAASSASTILLGESGTGKEVIAHMIHDLSGRRDGPFVAINCAALPETLMESELFGHERGAFTGADRRREGCFELANGGTLLLDEIGEMKVELQVKLLRVLEEHRLRRLGGSTEVTIDVRVLAASNRNLETAVHEKKFREDLYYRLNVFAIELPPLRERADDIAPLVEHFLRTIEMPEGKLVTGIDGEALEVLKSYEWPGNVRQLRNVLERALIVTRGPVITTADLPPNISSSREAKPTFEVRVGTSLDQVERELVQHTLAFTGGNRSEAARILGVSGKTIYNWLKSESGGGE